MTPNKVVVVTAWRRPEYLKRTLTALFNCRRIEDYRVLVQVDGKSGNDGKLLGPGPYADCVEPTLKFPVAVRPLSTCYGVAKAPLDALRWAFADANQVVKIEDDAVLTPDALEVADFFFNTVERNEDLMSRWTLMSLCAHGSKERAHPSRIREHGHITSPFAFCIHRHHWPFIERVWNCKVRPPYGWDWSLTYAMRLEGRRAVAPVWSRCENIGREGGVHDTPESFDAAQVGVSFSDGAETPIFSIEKISDPVKLEPWMEEEYAFGTRP